VGGTRSCRSGAPACWIEGPGGRVEGTDAEWLEDVHRLAVGLVARGLDVELSHYYECDDENGPDWSKPIPME
jgi:hypothetical protein